MFTVRTSNLRFIKRVLPNRFVQSIRKLRSSIQRPFPLFPHEVQSYIPAITANSTQALQNLFALGQFLLARTSCRRKKLVLVLFPCLEPKAPPMTQNVTPTKKRERRHLEKKRLQSLRVIECFIDF